VKLGADFSEDRKYRYRLWRKWREDVPSLMWIMLNPSTADESKDDPTIKRVMGFSINWGFGGCEIFNLFGWRSTYPVNLRQSPDPVGPQNDVLLTKAAWNDRPIVCAWGNVCKELKWREKDVLILLEGRDLRCLKLTAKGGPIHPLYQPAKAQMLHFSK
jgi:hypothetical protein